MTNNGPSMLAWLQDGSLVGIRTYSLELLGPRSPGGDRGSCPHPNTTTCPGHSSGAAWLPAGRVGCHNDPCAWRHQVGRHCLVLIHTQKWTPCSSCQHPMGCGGMMVQNMERYSCGGGRGPTTSLPPPARGYCGQACRAL